MAWRGKQKRKLDRSILNSQKSGGSKTGKSRKRLANIQQEGRKGGVATIKSGRQLVRVGKLENISDISTT